MPVCAEAGFVKFWQLKETASAPVLVVGRVLGVETGERVSEGLLPWKAETWTMTADFQVLRSWSLSGRPVAGDRLQVHYLAYGPSVTMFVNGSPPPLPSLKAGQVLILPLQENENPASKLWQLMADSGVNLIIHARAEIPDTGAQPATPRAFLDLEIASALSRGTPAEVSAAANYLAGQYEDLTGELMPLLEPVIGDERRRWAEVATNLLAAQGVPRPGVADLLAARAEPKDWPDRPSLFMAQASLKKLKASPETDSLLIELWIAEAPLHAWGSAKSLLEYADDPITAETLRQGLRNDLAGSVEIAWTLVHAGNHVWLGEALAQALRVVNRPDTASPDLQSAASLLRDYGSDRELKQLAALVRKYQTQDEQFYRVLWQNATEAGNPREVPVLAVVLLDRRSAFRETRYCDYALVELERAVGQHFGGDGKTVKERDEAVSRALEWLRSQGLSG